MRADTWKMFFYMDATDALTDMAFKSITEIMRGKSNDLVDAVIQLHAYNQVALRYRVTTTGLVFEQEVTLSTDCKQDLIDAATWAFTGNTADHTLIILSNHGYGALDPRWNPTSSKFEATGFDDSNNGNNSCAIPKKSMPIDFKSLHKNHRGFMFNGQSHTYLTNQALAEGLAYIQENLLNQKKIDIVAFDTCMGSMLEVASCIAPYAHYLVGVQSCALRDGFDYLGIMSVLSQGNSPRQTATQFVDTFDTYYKEHDEAGIYTCAALDLANAEVVNQALNKIVSQLLNHTEFLPLLDQARKESPRFCLWPIYSDLVAFWLIVENKLLNLPPSGTIYDIINSIHTLNNAAATMVIARCCGETTIENAHGFSIYLPPQIIEQSYCQSLFAQHSQWPTLMSLLCAHNGQQS
jgi:hypothetical protein